MSAKPRTSQLTQAPIGPTLAKMTTPMVLGIMAILFFNIVDIYFIGLIGAKELAAVSFTFPVSFILMNIAMGLGVGTTTVLAAKIGSGASNDAKRIILGALLLTLLLVAPLSFLGINSIQPLFTLLGAGQTTIPLITDYMNIWYAGLVFLYIPMVGNSAIRATGNTKTPSIIMALAGLANGIMDPILIFGLGPIPAMGIEGAAIATVISWVVATIAVLYMLNSRLRLLHWKSKVNGYLFQDWSSILKIGAPAAGSYFLAPIVLGVTTRLVAEHGETAVAGYGVGTRIESLAMVVIMALSSAITPFTGQNFGAGKHDRIRRGLKLALIFTVGWELLVTLILLLLAEPLAGLFNDDPLIINTTILFLWILPISYGFHGIVMLICSTLNALQRPLYGITINAAKLFLLCIPMACIGDYWFSLKGIFIGLSLANIVAGIIVLIWMIKNLERFTTPNTR